MNDDRFIASSSCPDREDIDMRLRRLTPQQAKKRQAVLREARKFWIQGFLEPSLQGLAFLELNLESSAEAIDPSQNLELEIPERSRPNSPQETKIISIFDRLGEGGLLLILGEPGAGKTTTLLELTRRLLNRSEQGLDYQIPMVLNLSFWAGAKPPIIRDWLANELNFNYQVPTPMVEDWIENRELVLLLDGWDEVNAEHQAAWIAALQKFHQDYCFKMVICSCFESCSILSNYLEFQETIYLHPLSLHQIYQCLDRTNANTLRGLVEKNRVLQELAKLPLMLKIIVVAYEGVSLDNLSETEVLQERRKQLFDAYIEQILRHLPRGRVDQGYSDTQTKRWLTWLAQRLVQHSQTVFYIEDIKKNWLQSQDEIKLYWPIGILISGLLGLSFGLGLWLVYGLLINGLIGVFNSDKIQLSRFIFWLMRGLIDSLINGFMAGILLGPIMLIFREETANIQYFTSRLIVTIKGYIPWNYARFLDYASNRQFLYKVDRGYLFSHRLLLEHFAQMDLEN